MNSSWGHCYLTLIGFDSWETAKHTGISECEPSVSIPWDREQKSDLKAKGKIATSEALHYRFLNYSSSYES